LGVAGLGKRFVDRWKDKESEISLVSKIKSIGRPSENLKQQISVVTHRLDAQSKTLDNAVQRFEARDAGIFQRIVKALSEHDEARANILAVELWEIRKVEKMLMHASLAMESVSMRLNTVSEMGDLVTVLGPAASVLNNIRSGMCAVLPEASQELESIGNLLTDIVVSTNQSSEMPMNVGKASAEAEKILQEAELAAENKLRDRLPEAAEGNAIKKRTRLEA
jgi:division protein CdvB (Snf7/Vps24/ESCRT-III family)